MPDPPKFSFGGPASTSGSSAPSIFGAAPTTNTSSSIFGQSTGNTPASSGTSLFGNTATAGGESKTSSLFGGAAPSAGGFSFGGNKGGNTPSGGGLFGGGGAGGSSGSTGFSFGGQKPADNNSSQPVSTQNTSSAPSPFGAPAPSQPASGGGLFGQLGGSNAPSQSPSGATTPAASKPSQLTFSTTPAGPPPSTSGTSGTSSMFGAKPASGGSSIFGQNSATTATSAFGATPAPPSGGLFSSKSNENQAPASAAPSGQPLFGKPLGDAQPKQGLFGGAGNASTPAASQGGQDTQKAPSFSFPAQNKPLFGAIDNQKPAESAAPAKPTFSLGATTSATPQPLSTQTATTPSVTGPGLFGSNTSPSTPGATPSLFPSLFQNKDNASTHAATATSAAPTSSLFSGLNQTPSAPATGAATPSLFSLGKKPDAPASSGPAPASTTTTSAPVATPSLFGTKPNQPVTSASTTAAPTTNTTGTAAGTTSSLGASTTGPAPSAASRLATKSLDEILTLWTTSLASHQKTFGSLATKISGWDRSLVENSDKISKLYARTFQAERDTAEVERQLSAVEGEQQELERYLDNYEKTVDEILARSGGADGGVDAERERTYRTAERCSARLTNMSHDLTSMIEEINLASTNLRQSNKSANTQDPLSQIVRVLNGHLAQLQLIDSGASALQQKVTVAQKETRSLGRNGGLGGDEVYSFARSFLSRR